MSTTDRLDTPMSTTSVEAVDVATMLQRALLGFVVLTGVLALLGAIGTLLAFDGAIGDAEADFLRWIADNRGGVLDSVATVGSSLSDTWTVIGVLVGATSMLWVTGARRHAAMVLLAVTLEFSSFLAVGAIVGRPRPDVETLTSVPSTPSFPSGHVAAAFVLYGSLVLVARSLSRSSVPAMMWSVPVIIALLVAASRVYEGVHNPTDVVAGLLLGVGALVAAAWATGIIETPVGRGAESRTDG